MMGHSISVPLISAAVGYWVLTAAEKEKNRIKKLGHWLGLLIIVVSLGSAACKIVCFAKACKMGGGYGMACPFTGKPMGGSPAQ